MNAQRWTMAKPRAGTIAQTTYPTFGAFILELAPPDGGISAVPDTVPDAGGIVRLVWTSRNSATARLFPSGVDVPVFGDSSIFVLDQTTFVLVLRGRGGVAVAVTRVRVRATVPSLLLPEPNASIDASNVLLSWRRSRNAWSYLLEISTDSTFSRVVHSVQTQDSSTTVSELGGRVEFFWRVCAWNDLGWSVSSSIRSFTAGFPAGTDLPEDFALRQNYPNPFNASTEILFELPAPSAVTLRVFDILGRVVETIVEDCFPAGFHRVRFSIERRSSGVYMAILRAGTFQSICKMLGIR
jgi:hypothetical protein